MSPSAEEIRRVAALARIEVAEVELQSVRDSLDGIFAMIGQLQAVDTAGIVPMAHAQDVVLRLREDVVTESDQHVLFQSVAPQVEADLYLVPRVIE